MRTRGDEMTLTIGRHHVGRGEPLFVIAEIGLNHGGSVDRALALVDAAAAAGASAVKLQTIVAAELVAPACPAPAHVQAASLREFFAAFELDEAAHHAIAARARAHGLALIATPLSEGAVDLLERVGVDAYKIASGDLTWTRLIDRCAHTGKPLILSTGMATIAEVAHGLAHAQLGGAASVALLHCVSAYPVPHGSENLRAIATLAEAFSMPVGLSDHGADTSAVPIAVALGASLYERHLVLTADRRLGGCRRLQHAGRAGRSHSHRAPGSLRSGIRPQGVPARRSRERPGQPPRAVCGARHGGRTHHHPRRRECPPAGVGSVAGSAGRAGRIGARTGHRCRHAVSRTRSRDSRCRSPSRGGHAWLAGRRRVYSDYGSARL